MGLLLPVSPLTHRCGLHPSIPAVAGRPRVKSSRSIGPSNRQHLLNRSGAASDASSSSASSAQREDAQHSAAQPDAAEDLLRATEELLAQLGNIKQSRPEASIAPEESGDNLVLHCDVNGCTIIPLAKGQPSSKGPLAGSLVATASTSQQNGAEVPRDFQLSEGPGWRIGLDRGSTDPTAYSAVVGGDGWSIALTRAEYNDFVKLVRNLRRSVATLDICGEWGQGRAATDEATLEIRTNRVWVQGRAPQQRLSMLQDFWKRGRQGANGSGNGQPEVAFALRFIITTPGGREVEGCWSPEAVMDVLQHLDQQAPEPKAKPQQQQPQRQGPIVVQSTA